MIVTRSLQFHRAAIVMMLIVMMCIAAACKESDLKLVSSNINKSTKAMAEIQTIIKAANATVPPLLSDAAAVRAFQVTLHVEQSTAKAIEMTRHIDALDPQSKQSLLAVLQPLLTDVTASINDPALTGIKDAKTKTAIIGSLVVIQTSLSAIQTAIAVH